MAHSVGWTLGTFRIVFGNIDSNDILECVLHYDLTTVAATTTNADNFCNAAHGVVSAGIVANLNTRTALVSYSMLLDDGANQAAGLKSVGSLGTVGTEPLPQAMCAIWRKRANGIGRRRFGHACFPGVDMSMLDDENTLSAAQITAYQGVASALNNAPALFGVAGSTHVLYHRDIDTRDAVYSFVPAASLRTNRHRTPGRGI